jgi:hypothetical protein
VPKGMACSRGTSSRPTPANQPSFPTQCLFHSMKCAFPWTRTTPRIPTQECLSHLWTLWTVQALK